MERKVILVVGPKERYLSWLRTTRGLGGVRVYHIGRPEDLQGFCFQCGKDEVVDLTEGVLEWAETLAYAQSVMS